jgi:hypothetical protein
METKQRQLFGFLSSLLLGLVYSLVSQFINTIFMPDVPLYVPPPGRFLLIVLGTLMIGLMGLIASWPEEGLPGVFLSALAGSVVTSIWTLYNQPGNRIVSFILLFLIFLPRLFFYLPLGVLIRWTISRWEMASIFEKKPLKGCLNTLVISVILAGAAGAFSLYSTEARQALEITNQIVQSGVEASTQDDIPSPLRNVNRFENYARGNYQLRVGSDPDLLPVLRPVAEYGVTESLIIIYFENGYFFGCVFTPPSKVPVCGDF